MGLKDYIWRLLLAQEHKLRGSEVSEAPHSSLQKLPSRSAMSERSRAPKWARGIIPTTSPQGAMGPPGARNPENPIPAEFWHADGTKMISGKF